MQGLAWHCVCVLSAVGHAVAIPHALRYANNASMLVNLMSRQDDTFDETDLTFIANLAAIGDSYSAGIGAGDRLGNILQAADPQSDWACSRYDHSYPYLVYSDPRFGDGYPNFQFLSCSGAVTEDVLNTQIPTLNSNQDAIMLSIGGNDIELVNILNQCIFQWAVFNWEQVTVAEIAAEFDAKYDWASDYDFEPLGYGCDAQLARTASLLASSDFSSKLDAVLSAAKAKLSASGKIYWTGYAKYFAEDLSSSCDAVTWTTWIHKTYNIWQEPQYLTSGHRQTMNNLVDQINAQLEAAASRAGSNVIFVNYDSYVGSFGGRYCEAGVDESTVDSNTRTGLMFYELNTWDPAGTTPWKRSNDDPLNGTFEGELGVFAEITTTVDPDAQLTNQETNSVITEVGNMTLETLEFQVPNLLPDGYGRVFHPQILLHELIANLITWEMMNVKEVSYGLEALPLQLSIDSCPITSAPVPDFYARILPLGASIVWGVGSTTGNGFRKPLRDALRQAGWKVNMVGSKNNGDMVDNNVEAHSGDRIDQIHTASTLSTKYQPNIVLINGGTNDCLQDYDIANFATRYNSLLDSLFDAIPNLTIIASIVIPGTASGIVQNRDAVNTQIRSLVSDRRYNQHQKIVLADVDVPAGFFTTDYLISDGIHPTDEGHRRLAAIYLEAIEEADAAGFLSAPADTGLSDEPGAKGSNTCEKTYGSGESHGPVNTQAGSGLDDGIYVHSSIGQGVKFSIYGTPPFNYTFARVAKAFGNHDIVLINDASADLGREYRVHANTGGAWSTDPNIFYLQDQCIARGVRWADVNADGLDDMVCISPNGDAHVSINQGSFKFSYLGLWKANEGPIQERILLADIDGDGRADYCTIADNGDITCWRNGGQGDLPEYWQPLGVIFTGKGFGDVHGVRFFDLNGDGRDDWMWVDNTGRTWTYTNNRACTKGTLEPLWRAGTNGAGDAYTHTGMGQDVGRGAIHFAKVYGVPEAFSLGGRADYVWVEDAGPWEDDKTLDVFHFHVWQNEGSGATKLKADGDHYCNMLGRANGAMDYVWIHSTGYMILYESLGGTFPSAPPYWGPNYQIWSASDEYGFDIDRRDLHLADWDGDGLCDIIYVKPDTGEMDVWLNQYKKGGDITKWTRLTNAGPTGSVTPCPEKRGVGIYDLAVRFADIDGNGRADYLCIEKNGRTWGYLNNDDGSLTYISQFKKSEDKDRANLRWVDVNGDGRDDMLWVDKFIGDATVFYNMGPIPASGSAYTWNNEGPAYEGAGQGSCLHWPDLDGDGRADMSLVDSVANTAQTWFNLCPGEGTSDNGDDPDTLTSTPLPVP